MLVAVQAATPNTNPASVFRGNTHVEVTDDYLIVHSNGIPDHATGPFPNPHNPNRILVQDYTFKIPRHPQWSDRVSRTPMGPIGVAVNGVPFYNPYNAEGADAAKSEVFDECCGHPDPMGRYHYHIYPKCIHTSFVDKPGEHSPLIGYAFDGYAIYGPNGDDGKPPTDLDSCNGHTDYVRASHYHVTTKYPYIIGGYHGVPERSNFDHGGGPGRGDAEEAGLPVAGADHRAAAACPMALLRMAGHLPATVDKTKLLGTFIIPSSSYFPFVAITAHRDAYAGNLPFQLPETCGLFPSPQGHCRGDGSDRLGAGSG